MTNLYPGDKVSPAEAGRLLKEQAARLAEGHRRSRGAMTTTTTTTTHQPVPMSAINQITVGDNGWHNVTEEYTAVYLGRSEFWTGLSAGDAVTVHRTTYFRPDGSVLAVDVFASDGGAWLAIHDESDLHYL